MTTQYSPLLMAIINCVSDALVICNEQRQIEAINPVFESLVSIKAKQLIGKEFELFSKNYHNPAFIDNFWKQLDKQRSWKGSIRLTQSSQNEYDLLLTAHYIEENSKNHYLLFFQINPKSQVATKEKNILNSQHDPLTQLPNQVLFHDRSEQAIIAAKRAQKSVALLLFGLDRFTIINEGLGHQTGDQLLCLVAERLTSCIRGSDTVARISGDNFALLLQVAAIDDSVIVAEKVLKSMLQPFQTDKQSVTLTASIGISLCPSDSDNANELLRHSGSALYHAKKNGGNQYTFFAQNMNDKAKFRIALENNLRRALNNQEFLLYYQPKVSAESQKIVGAEALIRWQDPSQGMVSPAEFIPIAEETGLIEPIGTWVLNEACRQTKIWQKAKLPKIKMSVNVSAHQFRSADFINILQTALTQSGLSADSMELEITESLLMNNPDRTIKRLNEIRELGFHLSIDDFGTGYSSLSYLTKFPITTLKIDRAFVYDIEKNKNMAEVAKAIICLSQGLELEVVAEGAESIQHVEFLRDNGCDMVQGYYYSKPLPADEFEQLLKVGVIQSSAK